MPRETEFWGSEPPKDFPTTIPPDLSHVPRAPRGTSPVLVVTWLPEAGKLQPVHHTGLKQKCRGPEAQRSSHKGHGCHSKGRQHITPATRENTLAEAERGLELKGPVCSCLLFFWAFQSPGHSGGLQAPDPPQHSLTTQHIPPPRFHSCFAFLPPLCKTNSPHPEGPTIRHRILQESAPAAPAFL